MGKTQFASIRVKNETKWPWRHGCYLSSLFNSSPFEIPPVVVDKEVNGGDEFDLVIPITRTMQPSEISSYEIQLAFYKNDGKQMGTPFMLKCANEVQDDSILNSAATQLTEAGMGTYDECLSALVKCGGDEGAAL